jgi:thymidylate synthase
MYLPIPSQTSCARAWVAAASALIDQRDEAYNVIIDVQDPISHDSADHAAITLLDRFLRDHDQNPIVTVANTIFPQSLYDEYGSPKFYDIYLEDFDRLSETKQWGRYFERMIRHRTFDGTVYRPLQELIEKMAKQEAKQKRFSSVYELAIYDPLFDRKVFRGGQCLSYLSFKVDDAGTLRLTALYRNHTYITRCLGNLIGLGRLQAFVAKGAGVKVGSLTCISTHATLDVGFKGEWGIKDARQLIRDADKILSA